MRTILFYGWEYPPSGGGVGGYTRNMAVALAATGCRVLVVCGRQENEGAAVTTEDGVEVHRRYTRAEIGSCSVVDAVLEIADREQVDLIEGADLYGECAGLLQRADRPPVHIKIHGCHAVRVLRRSHELHWWQAPLIWLSLLRQREQLQREQYCIRHADHLTVPSERLKRELQLQGGLGAERAEVLPNPGSEVEEPSRMEASVPTLLFVGRIDIGKGIQFLPEVLRVVSESVPDVVLEIAGADSYARGLGSLKAWLTQALGHDATRVRFLGKLDRAGLEDAYSRAWCLVLPSRWDNFPTVVLEAMSHGCPLVASSRGGAPEMVKGTVNQAADPGDPMFAEAVVGFLQNPDMRSKASQDGRDRIRHAYSGNEIATQYLDVLSAALNGTDT